MKITIETMRDIAPSGADITEGRENGAPIFCYFSHLFCERTASDILGMAHDGWITTADGTTYKDGAGLANGIVLALPVSCGGYYLAGYHWGDNDERVIWPDMYASPIEAARAADRHAERFAESQREDDEKWQACLAIEDQIDADCDRLSECLALRHHPRLGKRARAEICDLIARIKAGRATLANTYM